jgi:hypothetical protein
MEGPRVWAYMPGASPAETAPGPIPGRWVAEAAWPPATTALTFRLAPGRLSAGDVAPATADLRSDAVVGLQTPEWVPFAPPAFPQEQSPDDAASLVFDSEPLAAPLEILGHPTLRVRLAASAPTARLAARLTEVTPDGRSWLVSYGALNLTHRAGHAAPELLTPGVFDDIDLPLYLTARRFRAGSRLRLALSESLWPLLWPSPEPVTLTLDFAAASFTLPVRAPAADPPFPIPIVETTPGSGRGDPAITRGVSPDGCASFTEVWPASAGQVEETGTTVERGGPSVEASLDAADPASGHWRVWQSVRYRRDDWDCGLTSDVDLRADKTHFHIRERLTASRGGVAMFEREHTATIPRDLM